MRGLIFEIDGEVKEGDVKTLKDLQDIVGGYIEVICLPTGDLYLNENGIALDLPANPRATRYAKRRLREDGRVLMTADGWILGRCILLGSADSDGDMTECTVSIDYILQDKE